MYKIMGLYDRFPDILGMMGEFHEISYFIYQKPKYRCGKCVIMVASLRMQATVIVLI